MRETQATLQGSPRRGKTSCARTLRTARGAAFASTSSMHALFPTDSELSERSDNMRYRVRFGWTSCGRSREPNITAGSVTCRLRLLPPLQICTAEEVRVGYSQRAGFAPARASTSTRPDADRGRNTRRDCISKACGHNGVPADCPFRALGACDDMQLVMSRVWCWTGKRASK